ncbi:MAG TPA: ABC transporter ATP-binding protein [Acidobacteriota bacterium]|nr:ABC transporter ATP-binding protein [Acidobacteriota bacterium]
MNLINSPHTNGGESQTVISVRSLGVCFKARLGLFRKARPFWALRQVTFDVLAGETFGIIGPNGAGKSTLLRVMAGIRRPTEGSVESNGYDVTLLALQAGFLPYLSGRANVILNGILLGATRRQMVDRMDEVVDFAGLRDFIDWPLWSYSSGMRARLGFSTAYHVDPEVMLIDETLAAGDAEFSRKSAKAIRQRLRSDKTVVLVSHHLESIRSLCQRALWLENGRIRAVGPSSQVVEAYQNSSQKPKHLAVVKV